jgi:predicted Zn-dependent protease
MKTPKIFLPFLLLLLIIGCSKDPATSDNGTPGVDKSANLKALGDSANELLSDAKFTSIKLEVVYVTGYKPSDIALNSITQFISDRTFKPDGLSITTRAVASSGKAPFSIEEIVQIEKDERTAYNTGDEIAVFIYVADGSNEDDKDNTVVLGSAYRNTSIVLYGKTIEKIANNSNSLEKSNVEAVVLNHEFGHLFGLVNLGSPMQADHEDQVDKKHCSVDNCLMNSKIKFGGGIIDMINNNMPELDDLCINDLVANGGK